MTEVLKYININGAIHEVNKTGLSVHNRAYKFGDGIFDTIRIIGGRPLFMEDHFSRLSRGLKILKIETPREFGLGFYKSQIGDLLTKNGVSGSARIRATFFRKPGGLYTPTNNEMAYSIEVSNLEEKAFSLNKEGKKLGLYSEIPLTSNLLSPLKTTNCLPYILAGLSLKDSPYDEFFLINSSKNLVEAISSNFFVLIDGILYTPPIKDGCTAGVMRKKVIQLSKKLNIPVVESSISETTLLKAEEIFTTNAIKGPQWIGAYGKRRYFHKLSERLINELNQLAQS